MKESRRVRFPLFFTWFFHYVNVAEYCSRITTKFGIFEHSLTFKGKKLHVYEITTNKNIERKHSYTTIPNIDIKIFRIFLCFQLIDWSKMYAIWKKNELKLKDWNGDLPAARWGLLAQSSSIKGATLRVRTVRGQEMTISKIDNRLLWKCIFGTFKKSLVVSLILFLSFFLSSYLFLSYFFCHTRVRVRPIRCLVAGTRTRVLQRI